MVEVTQADREAAAELLTECLGLHWNSAARIAPEHLARHRIAARNAARNAALEEAAKVADELGGVRPKTADQEPFRAQHTRANTIATAIRALKGPSNG